MSGVSDASLIWRQLWEAWADALVIVDRSACIQAVNAAFCRLFNVQRPDGMGRPVGSFVEQPRMFTELFHAHDAGRTDPRYLTLHVGPDHRRHDVRLVTLDNAKLAAAVFVDTSERLRDAQMLEQIRSDAIAQVEAVVDRHMQVAQQIAGLLGETTAETKVSLLKLMAILRGEQE